MTKTLYEIDAFIEKLRVQRDELRLQLHLAKADVRDEWDELEQKLERLMAKADTLRHEAGAASGDVLEAAKQIGEEIRHGYEQIRKRF